MTSFIGEREREVNFVTFLRLLEDVAKRDGDHVSRVIYAEMSAKIRSRIVAGCSTHDVLDAIDRAYPSDTRLVELVDETTPAERPSALDIEAKRKGTWRQFIGDLRQVFRKW